MRRRRLRGLALAASAMACGAAASAQVSARERELEARVGAPVEVVVARRDIGARTPVRERSAARLLEQRLVPARYAPPDALTTPADAVGLRTAVPIPAGAYLTAGLLAPPEGQGPADGSPLGPGERAIELTVAGSDDLLAAPAGARVDVLVTTEGPDGGGRTEVALEAVQLLAVRRADEALAEGSGRAAEGPSRGALAATLRVPVRAAVFLAAADGFAREIRLLARPPGDRRTIGGLTASMAAGSP